MSFDEQIDFLKVLSLHGELFRALDDTFRRTPGIGIEIQSPGTWRLQLPDRPSPFWAVRITYRQGDVAEAEHESLLEAVAAAIRCAVGYLDE